MMWYEIPGCSGYRINHIAEVLSLRGNEPRILKPHVSAGRWQVRLKVEGCYRTYSVDDLMTRAHLTPVAAPVPSFVRTHHEAVRTRCDHDHEFTPQNTMWRKVRGKRYRMCRTCFNKRMKDYRAKRRGSARATG